MLYDTRMLETLITIGQLVFVYMTAWFLLALYLRNNSIVDIAWGLGFSVIALLTFMQSEKYMRQILVTLLTITWGLRLSVYILMRNRGKDEDFRYKKWREQWGENWVLMSYLKVFLLQGLIMILVSFPIIWVNTDNGIWLTKLDLYGAGLCLFGILFEATADAQLFLFKSIESNKGKVMMSGLWRYSRHPNYFGESLAWCGLFLMSYNVSGGLITIISPILITFFLLRVSGIPLLEKRYKDDKEYRKYCQTTSGFVPWLPKK